MSLCLHVVNNKIVDFVFHEENVPVILKKLSESTYCYGELLQGTYDDIKNSEWELYPERVNEFLGAISLLAIKNNKCFAVVDEDGINSIFYFHHGSEFIISTNLWDIVKIVKPTLSQVDEEWVRKSIIYTGTTDSTFIKNLHVLLPNTYLSYDIADNTLELKSLGDLWYTKERCDVDEAVEKVDKILKDSFKLISEKNGNEKTYGVGISGGLDSRVIPHYAKKQGLKLTGFNICTPKPNGLFTADSCKNAERMASIFGIPFKLVEWKAEYLPQKINTKIRNYPLGGGRNTFKFENNGMPDFDVLLTGGTGLLVGSELPANIDELTDIELKDVMKSKFIHLSSSSSFYDRAKRSISYLLKLPEQKKQSNKIIHEVFAREIRSGYDEIENYVDTMRAKGHDNVEIFENYFLNVLGFRNRNGSFESLLGTKKSYSIYIPFLLREVKKWDSSLLINRKVLNELIRKKIPEVANISTESYHGKPGETPNALKKVIAIVNRALKGNGTAIDENNVNKLAVKRYMNECFTNDYKWFYEIFNKEQVNTLLNHSKDPAIIINLWEMKMLIDILEDNAYLRF